MHVGGPTKDTEPVSMLLRSGDILVMGQSARLAVHGVPKVFSKSFPPSYLHPSTAGREKIHLMGCPLFLQRNERTCDGTDNSSSGGNGSDNTDHNHNYKRSAVSPSSSLPSSSSSPSSCSSKRQKFEHVDNHAGGYSNLTSDVHCAPCVCACGTNVSDTSGVVSRGFDTLHDETRLLRFLQTTRININVRQVTTTTTADVGQVTETAVCDIGDQGKK
jgi:hypothetical protein